MREGFSGEGKGECFFSGKERREGGEECFFRGEEGWFFVGREVFFF